MFYMTNTRYKFIIIDLICNIHTVFLIYVINLTNYNNIIDRVNSFPTEGFSEFRNTIIP